MDKKQTIFFSIALGLYILTAGISYAFFSGTKKELVVIPSPTKNANGEIVFDPGLPKTEVCPLNGEMYSKQQRDWWEKHRPLGIMIENHENSRPQSGISSADVVYEAVAEGGITRFLTVFYCKSDAQVGPVRSARTYFIDFISEYGDYPLYAHVGGANTSGPADALGQIVDYGWNAYNDLNQFSIGFPTFWRDYDRLGHTTETEHTMYTTSEKLWDFAKKDRKLTNLDEKGIAWDSNFIKYSFANDVEKSGRPQNQTVHIEFWEGYSQYSVDWIYDPLTNLYKRNNGGKPQIDKNTEKQLTAKNIIVMVMQESNANDGYEGNVHLLYKDKGTGKAKIFMNGKEVNGTWRKDSRTDRTVITDNLGNEIKFVRGTLWFTILPTDGIIKIK